MNIYEHQCYIAVINSYIDIIKSTGRKITYQKLAQEIGVQKPYFSKVMSKQTNLSQDQLYKICQYLQIKDEKYRYMTLLLEKERTGVEKRKKELSKEIAHYQSKFIQTKSYLEASIIEEQTQTINDYYLTAYAQIIHIAFSISKFSKKPEELRKELNLSQERFQSVISILLENEIIQYKDERYTSTRKSLHLSPDSTIFQAWLGQMRALSAQRNLQIDKSQKYNFSVVFSSDENAYKEIKTKFMKFISTIEKSVKKSENQQVYQLNFDLHEWL